MRMIICIYVAIIMSFNCTGCRSNKSIASAASPKPNLSYDVATRQTAPQINPQALAEAKEYYAQGQTQLKNGNAEMAAVYIELGLIRDPDNAGMRNLLNRLRAHADSDISCAILPQGSRTSGTTSAKIDSNHNDAIPVGVSTGAINIDKLLSTIEWANKRANDHVRLANTYWDSNHEKSKQESEMVIRYLEKRDQAMFQLGCIYANGGHQEKAREYFLQVVESQETSPLGTTAQVKLDGLGD